MPCYLFTYHAYGSWLPDRPAGYVRRKAGVLIADRQMAACYRKNLKEEVVEFSSEAQSLMIRAACEACSFLTARCHGIATDPSHIHLLISWHDNQVWQRISKSLKHRLTLELNAELMRQTWFSKGGSRKRVKDRSHFDYLMRVYLPRHRGKCFFESLGES